MNKIPLKQALLGILTSVLMVFGTITLGWLFYHYVKEHYAHDDTYRIAAIVQSTPDKESLKTVYLAELLGLSVDHPTNLYRFRSKEARRKLLANPLIKEARVKKVRPGTIYIDYVLRKPIAFLSDFANTAIDIEGMPFPFKPFFTPKKLPEIYLGISGSYDESPISGGQWGRKIAGPRIDLALELYQHLNALYCSDTVQLRRIDVSKAYAASYGQRQIVVILEKHQLKDLKTGPVLCRSRHILRLNTKNYIQGLADYSMLQPRLLETCAQTGETDISSIIFDLRLPQLAFYTKTKHDSEISQKVRSEK